MTAIADVIEALLTAYPAELAEDWDTGIGLTCGDPDDTLTGVLLSMDADTATVAEAVRLGAGLLVTHHPLLFRPVQSVATDTAKGALIHRMIRAGVAHFAAHTNADNAAGGVNDALAVVLQLTELAPLVPDADGSDTGSGRVGRLPTVMSLQEFTAFVAQRLPATVAGVRAAGDPARELRTVAICGGAGESFLPAAADAGADVYLTSDLRHHVVAEYVAVQGNPAVVDVAHWAGESPWLSTAAALIGERCPDLTVTVSTIRTDPWTLHAAPAGG